MPSINTELGERALSKMQHEINWKPLKARCLRQYPTWTKSHVDRILREYMRFLALKVATRDIYDTIVLAPALLDAMWQQHVLCTQQYYADCQLLLQANQILHYNSDAAMKLPEDVRNKRRELTKASLCMMFSGMYPEAKGIWDFDDEGDSNAASQHLLAQSSVAEEDTTMSDTEETPTESSGYGDNHEEEMTETEYSSLPPPPVKLKMTTKKNRNNRNKMNRKSKPTRTGGDTPKNKDTTSRRLLYIYRAGKVSKLQVYSYESILEIKEKIERRDGIPTQKQLLEWEGLELEDERQTIEQYGIPNDATLVLTKMRNVGSRHHQRLQEGLLDSLDEEDERDIAEEGNVEARDEAEDTRSPRRQQQQQQMCRIKPSSAGSRHQKPPLHPSYSGEEEFTYPGDSYAAALPPSDTMDSADHHRHHQAILNKMRIQSHNNSNNSSGLHSEQEYSMEEDIPTTPPRPRHKPSAPSLQLYINTIMGFTITLSAKVSDSILRIKQMIEEQEDIPLNKQILVLEGRTMEDQQLLSDYTRDTSLHVLLRLRGGSTTASSEFSESTTVPSSTVPVVPMKKPPTMNNNNINNSNKNMAAQAQKRATTAAARAKQRPKSPPKRSTTPIIGRPLWT